MEKNNDDSNNIAKAFLEYASINYKKLLHSANHTTNFSPLIVDYLNTTIINCHRFIVKNVFDVKKDNLDDSFYLFICLSLKNEFLATLQKEKNQRKKRGLIKNGFLLKNSHTKDEETISVKKKDKINSNVNPDILINDPIQDDIEQETKQSKVLLAQEIENYIKSNFHPTEFLLFTFYFGNYMTEEGHAKKLSYREVGEYTGFSESFVKKTIENILIQTQKKFFKTYLKIK